MTSGPEDRRARERAIDPGASFIVQAPAGSGKTELLIQRYLALLGTVDRPEEVLAITFTRKAAGEMRDRVLAALERAGDERRPDEPHLATTWSLARGVRARDGEQEWGLMESPARLQVMTIDAFNALLVRRLPLVSGVGGPVAVAEDAATLYEQAARRVLRAAGTRSEPARLARRLLAHLDNDFELATRQLSYLLSRRDHWLRRVMGVKAEEPGRRREVLEASLRREIERVLARAAAAFPATLGEELGDLADYAAGRLAESRPEHPIVACRDLKGLPPADVSALNAWRGIASLLLTTSGAWRRAVNKSAGFPPDDKTRKERMEALLEALSDRVGLEALLGEVQGLPPAAYTDDQWATLDDLLALLPACAGELELAFRARGELDYVALAARARSALGAPEEPTDLALALDYRIRHILVDEFQDVSESQVELLAALTAGWTGEDGRTLFCVGDPMQSIYRFREAEVALYLRVRADGLGPLSLSPLSLSANFRSRPGLVDWCNEVFAGVFPGREEPTLGAVSHAPSAAARPSAKAPPVTIAAAPHGDDAAEAAAVVDRIEALRAAAPATGIAVLVRARPHLRSIARELRIRGVTYEAVEIEPLASRQPIQDLLALTRALIHLGDRTAWLAVLRAPWCGLRLDDLARLGQADELTIWEALANEAGEADPEQAPGPRLARLVDAFRPAIGRRGRRPLHRLVEGLWLALGGPATAPDPTSLADAGRFFELLRRLEVAGELPDADALEERLDELYAAADPEGAVKLMTVHKAKGLEFDHVLLPGLDRLPRNKPTPLLYWQETVRRDGAADLLLAPVAPRGEKRDALQEYIADLERRRDGFELQRLLYVAATRAREGLHLFARLPATTEAGQQRAPDRRSMLALLWPQLGEAFAAAEVAPAAAAAPGSPEPRLRRLSLDWERPPPATDLALGTPAAAHEDIPEEDIVFEWASETVRVVGTVAHRYFERIAADGPDAWDEARLAAERPRVLALLAEAGVPGAQVEEGADQVMSALRTTLADEQGRWVLGNGRGHGESELAVAGQLDGRTVHRRIDRCFLDESGVRWIVDFKVSPHKEKNPDEFIAAEIDRYRPQLENYARLLAELYPEERERRVALYFALQGRLESWTPACG